MKKIIAMILSTILLFAAVPAYAEDVVEITAEVQVFTVGISVKTTLSGRLTLKVYNPEKDTLLHIWQENVYEAKEDGNVYTFDSFDLDTDAETGKYHVVINDTFSAEFLFVNSKDKGAFYKSLALATADELELVLKNGADAGIVDFDLKGYFDYSDDVKDNINAGIEALELPVPGENPEEEELKAFAEVFEPEMERLLCAAELVTADAEDFAKVVSETAEIFDLDLTYYSDEKLDMDPEWVQKRMSTLKLPTFDTEDVQKAFDTAMLLAMIDEVGYATVTKALSHYNGGCIDLNTEITEDFSDSQMNNVSRKLKQNAASLENAKDIEEAYEAYAEEIAEDAESGSSGGGGSSSSGGGGGGGSTGGSRKPSTGTETKPEDSKPSVTFSDINEIPWAKESILYLASKGVISGKGDGKFYPGDTVTREEFVKIIVEAFSLSMKGASVSFEDVEEDRWSYSYIASAYNLGIIKGVSETAFNPTGRMTREDMAVIMYRVANLAGLSVDSEELTFADSENIASYAKEAVAALTDAGVLSGMDDNLYYPQYTVTRAQAAKVVYELLSSIGGVK